MLNTKDIRTSPIIILIIQEIFVLSHLPLITNDHIKNLTSGYIIIIEIVIFKSKLKFAFIIIFVNNEKETISTYV